MTEVFICDAVRTPFGRYGGALSSIRTDDLALQRVELARVLAMTDRLAPDRAEALRLRFFAGLDSAEIAPIMGRSEAAVKMLVHRALTDLREQLEATK